MRQNVDYGPKTTKRSLASALFLNSKGLRCPGFFPLRAKSALLINFYFNETSWYQLRKNIFIRYDWVDSHVESIWCKTWMQPVLRYPSKYFLWNGKITKELEKKELKRKDEGLSCLPATPVHGWDFGNLQIDTIRKLDGAEPGVGQSGPWLCSQRAQSDGQCSGLLLPPLLWVLGSWSHAEKIRTGLTPI